MNIETVIGFDAEGDACIFVSIRDENGEHIRYATDDELEVLLEAIDGRIADAFEATAGV